MSVDDYIEVRRESLASRPVAVITPEIEVEIRYAYDAGLAAGSRVREQANPAWTHPEAYAMCPGCASRGDAAHIAACCGNLITEMMDASDDVSSGHAHDAAHAVIEAVQKQMTRRGFVNLAELSDMADALWGSK